MNTFNTKVNELIPIIKNHLEHYNVSLDQVDSYKTNLAEYNKQFDELNKLIKTKKARLRLESKVKSKEYYVNMMIAWFFATSLAKQYKDTITYIEDNKLDIWVHNKTIQKAIESYRITDSQKEYLRSLKRR